MEDWMAALYGEAPRFDEGTLFQGGEYKAAMESQHRLRDQMIAQFGDGIVGLLNQYTDALYEEMELEAQHYFQEGCRAAKKTQ